MTQTTAAHCEDCGFGWHTAAMVEGLTLLGSCPRCNGSLSFDQSGGLAARPVHELRGGGSDAAPHLVLGLPRAW